MSQPKNSVLANGALSFSQKLRYNTQGPR